MGTWSTKQMCIQSHSIKASAWGSWDQACCPVEEPCGLPWWSSVGFTNSQTLNNHYRTRIKGLLFKQMDVTMKQRNNVIRSIRPKSFPQEEVAKKPSLPSLSQAPDCISSSLPAQTAKMWWHSHYTAGFRRCPLRHASEFQNELSWGRRGQGKSSASALQKDPWLGCGGDVQISKTSLSSRLPWDLRVRLISPSTPVEAVVTS